MNPVVERFQQFRMDGNIIPHAWYQSPLLAQKSGKPNLVAITLLADVIYWYRPAEIRDEASGTHLGYRQKFSADKLQKNYRKWGIGFGFTLRQVEDAMAFLKAAGLVTVEVRKVVMEMGTFPKCAFIEPVFDAVQILTYPPDEKVSDGKRSPVITGDKSLSGGRTSPVPGGKPSRPGGRHGTPERENPKSPSETPPENTSGEAAGATTDVLASPLGREEQTFTPWADLTPAKQQPWRDKAGAEMTTAYSLAKTKPSRRVIEHRAQSMYEIAQRERVQE